MTGMTPQKCSRECRTTKKNLWQLQWNWWYLRNGQSIEAAQMKASYKQSNNRLFSFLFFFFLMRMATLLAPVYLPTANHSLLQLRDVSTHAVRIPCRCGSVYLHIPIRYSALAVPASALLCNLYIICKCVHSAPSAESSIYRLDIDMELAV